VSYLQISNSLNKENNKHVLPFLISWVVLTMKP